MNINITPLNSLISEEETIENNFLDINHKEYESCYETSRKCLQLADTIILNNKRLVDDNQRLQRIIHMMQKKMNQMNNTIKDLTYQKEINKLYMIPYFKNFLKLTEKEKKEKCPICLDQLMTISHEDIVKTSCNHIFHGSCYYQNRASAENKDSCSICRQRHIPLDVGYIDNKKEWCPYTEIQTKDNLIKVLDITPDINIPSIEEIMCQIYNKTKSSIKYY